MEADCKLIIYVYHQPGQQESKCSNFSSSTLFINRFKDAF